jgi:predicted transcriptional regulator
MLKRADYNSSDDDTLAEESSDYQYHYYYRVSDSQRNILKAISQNPGIRYNYLARLTGFANGVLTYHLNILEQSNYINKFRHDKITRYYPLNISKRELSIISHLRVRTEKDIIMFTLEHDSCTFNEIVKHSGKSPSTISWHLRRLCAGGIIAVHYGQYNIYRIIDKKLVNQMLRKYKQSFADKVIDNFVDMANQL